MLEAAGWRVRVPSQPVCCGLTWISTGQLATPSGCSSAPWTRWLRTCERGTRVVGLEPSCTAVFRQRRARAVPRRPRRQRLRRADRHPGRTAARPHRGWQPPQLAGHAIAQTHCHQHAIMGYDADQALLRAAGVDLTCSTPAAAAWPATSASSRATTRSPGPAPNGSCCPPCATPPTPWYSPTASAAVPRSSRADRPQPDPPGRDWPRRPARPAGPAVPPARPGTADYARLAAGAAAVARLAAGLGAAARWHRHRG